MTDNLRGALYMMLAMLGFGIEDTFFKEATGTGGISPGMGTVQFGLTALIIYAGYAHQKGVPLWDPHYLRRGLLIRAGFEIVGRLFFALSLAYTPLSTTSAVLQAAPLVVMVAAGLILGERIGPRRWIATALGFIGVLMIIRPSTSGMQVNAVFALLGMIGFAGRDVATRTAPPHVHAAQLGLLGFGVVTFAGLIIMAFEPPPTLPTITGVSLICGTALAGVIGYTALTAAMRTGEVSVVAPFRYVRLLVALVLAYAIFDERPGILTLAGAALIVGSGVWTLWRDGRAGAHARTRVSPAP